LPSGKKFGHGGGFFHETLTGAPGSMVQTRIIAHDCPRKQQLAKIESVAFLRKNEHHILDLRRQFSPSRCRISLSELALCMFVFFDAALRSSSCWS
jgi:hypothetical protein